MPVSTFFSAPVTRYVSFSKLLSSRPRSSATTALTVSHALLAHPTPAARCATSNSPWPSVRYCTLLRADPTTRNTLPGWSRWWLSLKPSLSSPCWWDCTLEGQAVKMTCFVFVSNTSPSALNPAWYTGRVAWSSLQETVRSNVSEKPPSHSADPQGASPSGRHHHTEAYLFSPSSSSWAFTIVFATKISPVVGSTARPAGWKRTVRSRGSSPVREKESESESVEEKPSVLRIWGVPSSLYALRSIAAIISFPFRSSVTPASSSLSSPVLCTSCSRAPRSVTQSMLRTGS
mmetsp:Transcript_12945/g.27348  ORF Transcript_12945/g.27348 Transcript_12945/m.27348 type:complete len:289 (-) Transcript_12945:506-1372(-)